MANQPDADRWKSLADDLGIPESQAQTGDPCSPEAQSSFPPAQNISPPPPAAGPKQAIAVTADPMDDEFTFSPRTPLVREVVIEETVEIKSTQTIIAKETPPDSHEFCFGNAEESGNSETQESEENGAKEADSEEGGLDEAPQEEIRTVVFSSPEEAAECESQPPDPEGDEPVEEIDLNKWSVPPWQEIIDSLYRPER